jgi:hypothetical protein
MIATRDLDPAARVRGRRGLLRPPSPPWAELEAIAAVLGPS